MMHDFGRFRADDATSILAIDPAAPEVTEPSDQIVVDLPSAEVRCFDAYRIEDLAWPNTPRSLP